MKRKAQNQEDELNMLMEQLASLQNEGEQEKQKQRMMEEDFDRERNDMYDTIYELNSQLKLKNYII